MALGGRDGQAPAQGPPAAGLAQRERFRVALRFERRHALANRLCCLCQLIVGRHCVQVGCYCCRQECPLDTPQALAVRLWCFSCIFCLATPEVEMQIFPGSTHPPTFKGSYLYIFPLEQKCQEMTNGLQPDAALLRPTCTGLQICIAAPKHLYH